MHSMVISVIGYELSFILKINNKTGHVNYSLHSNLIELYIELYI